MKPDDVSRKIYQVSILSADVHTVNTGQPTWERKALQLFDLKFVVSEKFFIRATIAHVVFRRRIVVQTAKWRAVDRQVNRSIGKRRHYFAAVSIPDSVLIGDILR